MLFLSKVFASVTDWLAAILALIPVALWIFVQQSYPGGPERFFVIGTLLYWMIPLILAIWGITFFLDLKNKKPKLNFRAHGGGAFIGFVFAFLASQAFPPSARVQWDETELLSTSYAMAFQHSALAPSMTVPGPRGAEPVAYGLGHRPTLYPFAVSLFHKALGASEQNPLWANVFFLAIFFYILFLRGFRSGGIATAFAATLFAASAPLLFWVGTSGGMDLLHLLLVTVLLISVADFCEAPSKQTFPSIVFLATLTSYTRYETIGGAMILLLIASLRALNAGVPKRDLMLPLSAMPVLLLPLLLQLSGPAFEFKVVGENPVFQLTNLPTNARSLISALLSWNIGTYHGPLSVCGLISIAAMFINGSWRGLPMIVAIMLFCSTTIVFCFFDASPLQFQSARLYLPISVGIALSPLIWLRTFQSRRSAYALLVAASFSFAAAWISFAGKKILPDSLDTLAIERIGPFVAQQDPRTLYVYDPPGFLVTRGYAAIDSDIFLQDRARWRSLRNKGLLQRILWIQTGSEFPDRDAIEARRKLEAMAGIEVARFPLQPYPTVIRELPF